jgi:hypothetical protein
VGLKRTSWEWFKSLNRAKFTEKAKVCQGQNSKMQKKFSGIWLWNRLGFQAQIEDLRLKWCTHGRNSKNSTTGRSLPFPEKIVLADEIFLFH